MDYLVAALLAVIEGITEFLPISSTGHMILVENFVRLGDNEEFANAFLVIVQLPAIAAVLVYFWRDLWPFDGGKHDLPAAVRLWCKIAVAFLPAAVLGLLLDDFIEARLFNPLTVALALIVGGALLIAIEKLRHREHVPTVHDLAFSTAFFIGCFQCLAMIPGTSRSAATIIGALLLGASRPAAAEFSFFLAVPTMAGATAVTLAKRGVAFTAHEWGVMAVGGAISFLTAYAVIAFLMHYIRKRDFALFGYYRIVLGVIVLAWMAFGPG